MDQLATLGVSPSPESRKLSVYQAARKYSTRELRKYSSPRPMISVSEDTTADGAGKLGHGLIYPKFFLVA